jgi:hypothetical protein
LNASWAPTLLQHFAEQAHEVFAAETLIHEPAVFLFAASRQSSPIVRRTASVCSFLPLKSGRTRDVLDKSKIERLVEERKANPNPKPGRA